MRISAITHALPALLCAATLGCGGSGPSGPTGSGTMNVHLVDGPDADYSSIVLQVKELLIHRAPTSADPSDHWETLADFSGNPGGVKTIELLKLTNGVYETLADGKSLPAGHYDQMRMVLGSGNTVTPTGGSPEPLKVPSGMQSGVKFDVSFDVAPGTTRDVFIDFDAHRSIFVHQAGNSGKYMMRPVIRAYDKLVTGSISGTLTATVGSAPLGGVDVVAEQVGQDGRPVVVRATRTDATTGKYLLDLLPVGGSYYVVAQPVVTGTTPSVYFPRASAAIAITEATPTRTWDSAFDLAPAGAWTSVGGTVTVAASADQTDTVAIYGSFDTGATTPTRLLVRSAAAPVVTGVESYKIDYVPIFDGGYSLDLQRVTVAADGSETTSWSLPADATKFLAAVPAPTLPVAPVTRNFTGVP